MLMSRPDPNSVVERLRVPATEPLTDSELPRVSIVILNWNGKHHLEPCFETLAALDYPKDKYEVVLVDNGSSDGSQDEMREKHAWVRLVENEDNAGFSKGCNQGVRASDSPEVVVFLNNDMRVEEAWLRELVSPIARGECAVLIPEPDSMNVMRKVKTLKRQNYFGELSLLNEDACASAHILAVRGIALEKLDISGNALEDAGVSAIARALAASEWVQTVQLASHPLPVQQLPPERALALPPPALLHLPAQPEPAQRAAMLAASAKKAASALPRRLRCWAPRAPAKRVWQSA